MLPEGFRHVEFDSVASTNTLALDYANKGDAGNLWITAKAQSAGKGSRGRGWVSQPGNLYASLLLLTPVQTRHLANLTFVTSLALYEALAQFVPRDQLALKWPNDLLMNGAKISGILLENHRQNEASSALIIGLGVNCVSHPTTANYQATNLKVQGFDVSAHLLFEVLAQKFDQYLQVWDDGKNFAAIRQLWLERAIGIGEEIVVKMSGSQLRGKFDAIDEWGRLVLKTPDQAIQKISTADIFFSNSN